MSFEYLIINPKTGERASTQVKTGNSELNRDDYAPVGRRVFLFQSNNLYAGSEAKNVECIPPPVLAQFLKKERGWLPGVFGKKMEMLGL